jgi:hypothetical protein
MPTSVSITGRRSSIINAFIASITPVVYPTDEETLEALEILRMDPQRPACAYSGDTYTEWAHLRPLVMQQRSTGCISEIANLVPACGECNQSKGNKPWRGWILSDAPRSPKSPQVTALEGKIVRLEAYEAWRDVTPLDFEQIIGPDLWCGVGPKKISEHFCYVAVHKDHVNFGFNCGAELSDPEGLLRGPANSCGIRG